MITSLIIFSLGIMPIFATHTTVVTLTDVELNQVLQILIQHLAGSIIVPITLLQELGFNHPSIIYYLQSIGYYILY
jgi:hypothetical protein